VKELQGIEMNEQRLTSIRNPKGVYWSSGLWSQSLGLSAKCSGTLDECSGTLSQCSGTFSIRWDFGANVRELRANVQEHFQSVGILEPKVLNFGLKVLNSGNEDLRLEK